jgi:hypothetical protein
MKNMRTLFFSVCIICASYTGFAQCGTSFIDDCASDLGNAIYLKDFKVELPKVAKKQPAPVKRFAIVLNAGTTYKITACNAPEYDAASIIQVYDNSRLLGSSFNMQTGKIYKDFMMQCSRTGVYYVFVSFQDGKEGCSSAILSYVNPKK